MGGGSLVLGSWSTDNLFLGLVWIYPEKPTATDTVVGGYDNDVDVDMMTGNSDGSKRACVGLPTGQKIHWTDNSVRVGDRWMWGLFIMNR